MINDRPVFIHAAFRFHTFVYEPWWSVGGATPTTVTLCYIFHVYHRKTGKGREQRDSGAPCFDLMTQEADQGGEIAKSREAISETQ